jgi:hypothetical protein
MFADEFITVRREQAISRRSWWRLFACWLPPTVRRFEDTLDDTRWLAAPT